MQSQDASHRHGRAVSARTGVQLLASAMALDGNRLRRIEGVQQTGVRAIGARQALR